MKYAHYNKTNGKLLGWYDKKIHKSIPKPNIGIRNEDWKIALNNEYNFVDAEAKRLSFKDFRIPKTEAELEEIADEEAYNLYLKAEADYKKAKWKAKGKPAFVGK